MWTSSRLASARAYLREYFFVLGDARARLPVILALLVLVSLLDVLGLGAMTPLIFALSGASHAGSGVTGPDWRFSAADYGPLELSLLASFAVAIFALRSVIGYRAQKSIVIFSEGVREHLMSRLMASYLRRPYEFFLQKNSAELVNTLVYITWIYVSSTLTASLRLFADVVMFVAIVAFLAWTHWMAVATVLMVLIVVVIGYGSFAGHRIANVGREVSRASDAIIRAANHGIGGLREVRILGAERHWLNDLSDHARKLAHAHASFGALQLIPRYLVETCFVGLIVALAVMAVWGVVDGGQLMPVLGIFAIAAMRLMPGTASMVGAINSLRSSRDALGRLAVDLEDLMQEERRSAQTAAPAVAPPRSEPPPFHEVRFEHVTYTYPGANRPAIENVSFAFAAGQAVGLIGRSGAGKSTVADILMGLLSPQAGRVVVDGADVQGDLRGWMDRLAYIPQSIYLFDDTVLVNITLNAKDAEIDQRRLQDAVHAAQLQGVIDRLPQGVQTVIGERGVRLSGGERQRVAIARALYHKRQLILMDEATAALDSETEREVVNVIQHLHGKQTFLVIAHRLSTLESCDAIYKVEDGVLVGAANAQPTRAFR